MGQVQNSITPEERELCFTVADGHHGILMKIYDLRILCERSRRLPYIEILKWLVKSKITGQNFMEYLIKQNDNSMLVLAKRVRAKIFSDHKLRPVIGRYQI